MFCTKCGSQIPDGSKFCPDCGADLSFEKQIKETANSFFNKAEKEIGSAISEVHQTINNGGNGGSYNGGRLKTDRSIVFYILLSFVTCGIYPLYFIYKITQDINVVCDGDGDHTPGLVQLFLLSIITCGIYSYIWYYKLGNRLTANAPRYGLTFQENGTTILLWNLFGVVLCGIGPFIAMNIIIKNTNMLCDAYNKSHGV